MRPRGRRVAGPKKLQANRAELAVIAERCAAATGGRASVVLERLVFDASTAKHKTLPHHELDAASFRALELARMPEQGRGGLQQYVKNRIDIANRLHPMGDGRPRFLAYHTYSSLRSEEGFPDEIIIDRHRYVLHAWELKAEDGEVSELQTWWLGALENFGLLIDATLQAGSGRPPPTSRVDVRVIRPSDVVYIDAALGLS